MKKIYNIEFTAIEETLYSVQIEAESPEEALKKFSDPETDRGEYREEEFHGTIDECNISVTGYFKNSKLGYSKYIPFTEKEILKIRNNKENN